MAYAITALFKLQLEIDKCEDDKLINNVENDLREYKKLINET